MAPIPSPDPPADGRRAEAMFLAWLMGLPPSVDPSLAATAALARVEAMPTDDAGELRRLAGFLEEAMSWPRPALEHLAGRRPRRHRRGTPA